MRTTQQMPNDNPPTVERHPYHCPVCFKVTDHSRYVQGEWEFFTCRVCGNLLKFKLRRE